MRVVHLAEVTAERVIGGAERVLRNQALGLAALGHRVELLVRAPKDATEDAIMVGGIREWRYSVNRGHEAAFLWSSVRRSLAQFDRLCLTGPIDAVVIHQAVAGLGPLLSRGHAASRWVYVCHSLAHEEFESRQGPARSALVRVRQQLNVRARRAIEHFVIAGCDSVVVLSEFMRQKVMAVHGIPPERIALVPGATDPQTFTPVQDRKAVRHALDLPVDRTILFTVRNLVPRMGLENLLEAVARLGVCRLRCTLVIGGVGPLREALESSIHQLGLDEVVQLAGFIPEARLAQYYQAADLVVVPTFQLEGFGLVTVEAMACGTPVLGTPVGALPEVLNQVDPILVAEGTDGRSLARSLERVLERLQNPGEFNRLARKGRALIERRYNWRQHCEDLVRVLGEPVEFRKVA